MNKDTEKAMWLSVKMEADALTRLVRRLTTLLNECNKKHGAMVSRKKEKLGNQLHEYKTVDEAHEAYGWGDINRKEFETIRTCIETGTKAAEQDTVHNVMSIYLKDIISKLNTQSRELRYELMTPEEKAAHDQSVSDWKGKIQKIRDKRGNI